MIVFSAPRLQHIRCGVLAIGISLSMMASTSIAYAQSNSKKPSGVQQKKKSNVVRKKTNLSARQISLNNKIIKATNVVLAELLETSKLINGGGAFSARLAKQRTAISKARQSATKLARFYLAVDMACDRKTLSGELSKDDSGKMKKMLDGYYAMIDNLMIAASAPAGKFDAKVFNKHVTTLKYSNFNTQMEQARKKLVSKN